jgi:hypothetical protein
VQVVAVLQNVRYGKCVFVPRLPNTNADYHVRVSDVQLKLVRILLHVSIVSSRFADRRIRFPTSALNPKFCFRSNLPRTVADEGNEVATSVRFYMKEEQCDMFVRFRQSLSVTHQRYQIVIPFAQNKRCSIYHVQFKDDDGNFYLSCDGCLRTFL